MVRGGLGFPRAIAAQRSAGGDRLHVADSCAYRVIDTSTCAVHDVARAVAAKLKFPTSVSISTRHVLLTSEAFGLIQVFNHEGKLLRDIEGFSQPGDAIECEDGSFLVTEPAAGRVLHKTLWTMQVITGGLSFPSAFAHAGNGAVYVAESMAGRLLRIDIKTGASMCVAAGLGTVRAIDVAPDGAVAVLTADGRLLTLDPMHGALTLIASGLPIGYLSTPYPRSGGLAVGSSGCFYVAADAENAIYRIQEQ